MHSIELKVCKIPVFDPATGKERPGVNFSYLEMLLTIVGGVQGKGVSISEMLMPLEICGELKKHKDGDTVILTEPQFAYMLQRLNKFDEAKSWAINSSVVVDFYNDVTQAPKLSDPEKASNWEQAKEKAATDFDVEDKIK